METSPFLRPYDPTFEGIVTDGAVHVLERHGVTGFSISKIARWMRVTPSALLNDHSRSRLMEIVVMTFGDRWLEWSTTTESPSSAALSSSAALRLPQTRDELRGVRAWADLRRLADSAEVCGDAAARVRVAEVDCAERDLLGQLVTSLAPPCCPPSRVDIAVLMALTTGLRLDLAATAPALELRQAREVLQRGVDALTLHAGTCGDLRTAS
jgi:hypothetical protein